MRSGQFMTEISALIGSSKLRFTGCRGCKVSYSYAVKYLVVTSIPEVPYHSSWIRTKQCVNETQQLETSVGSYNDTKSTDLMQKSGGEKSEDESHREFRNGEQSVRR